MRDENEEISPGASRAIGAMRARVASRIADVMAARARVASPEGAGAEARDDAGDEEAVHDYRVGLRRLRSALRALRCLWTKGALRPLEVALKELADATGDVRDEEVLVGTLKRLTLSEGAGAALATWRRGRARRLRGARALAARKLAGPDLGGRLQATLHAIEVALAAPPAKPLTLHRLARRSVGKLVPEIVARAASTGVDDVEGMHALRIRVKRLRYGIELVLEGEATEAALKITAKLQKRLGELHDLDEAVARIGRSWGLQRPVRVEITEKLAAQRDKIAHKARRELDEALPHLVREVSDLVAALDR